MDHRYFFLKNTDIILVCSTFVFILIENRSNNLFLVQIDISGADIHISSVLSSDMHKFLCHIHPAPNVIFTFSPKCLNTDIEMDLYCYHIWPWQIVWVPHFRTFCNNAYNSQMHGFTWVEMSLFNYLTSDSAYREVHSLVNSCICRIPNA